MEAKPTVRQGKKPFEPRRRFRQARPLKERLLIVSREAKLRAETLPAGAARQFFHVAREMKIIAETEDWISHRRRNEFQRPAAKLSRQRTQRTSGAKL
jgi:hypothetical protein